jgi:YD repeat-containing protein
MPRGATTQNRSFVYDDAGRMTSSTNPESGTVTYTYNSDNTLQYKHDAKGQDTVYTYDIVKRVTMVQRFPNGRRNAEDTCQQITYSYNSNPYDSAYSQYATGRLTAAQYKVCTANSTITEMYSYNPAGSVVDKRLHIYKPWSGLDAVADVDVAYAYTDLGEYALSIAPGAHSVEIRTEGADEFRLTVDTPSPGIYRNRLNIDESARAKP